MVSCQRNPVIRRLREYQNLLITLLTPLVFAPIPIVYQSPASKCLYALVLMLVYLLTEALPLPVTGLLPSVAFPLLGVMDAAAVGSSYFNDTVLFIVGILILSTAVERTNLHKRIVLRALLLFGSNPYGILCGLFIICGFISMWLMNTSVLSMMLPIGKALGEELDKQLNGPDASAEEYSIDAGETDDADTNKCSRDVITKVDVKLTHEADKKGEKKNALTCLLLLGITYSTTIGGSATLIGTVTPIAANAQLTRAFGPESVLEFDTYLAYAVPLQLISLILAYLWMVFLVHRTIRRQRRRSHTCQKSVEEGKDRVKLYIKREYLKLGDMKWSEGATLIIIGGYILMLFFADLKFIKGWKSLFPPGQVSVTCVTSAVALIFFIVPYDKPSCVTPGDGKKRGTILEWDYVVKKVQWGVLLIIGGYFTIGDGMRASGVSAVVEDYFRDNVGDQQPWVVLLVVTITLGLLTEVMGNVPVLVSAFPILTSLASVTSVHPLYYIVPAILSTNLAFMFPVASPVTMILYSSGDVTIGDMVKAGWMMNVMSLTFINLLGNSYAYTIFNLDTIPAWAMPDNSTSVPSPTSLANITSSV